jgi:hypothetical protein
MSLYHPGSPCLFPTLPATASAATFELLSGLKLSQYCTGDTYITTFRSYSNSFQTNACSTLHGSSGSISEFTLKRC